MSSISTPLPANPAPVTSPTNGGVPRSLALLVAGTLFMENLDGTIVSTAAPRMARSLGVAPVDINVVITAYLLTLAVLIPGSGWIADRFGSRRIFAVAIAVFTISSIACAASTSLTELTAMRIVQGVGGAMMVPVGRLVVLRTTEKADLLRAIAYLTWPALIAPVFAPAVGGLIVTYSSWRWIFLINVPLGAVALACTRGLVPNLRHDRPPPLDWRGFLLIGVAIFGVVYALEQVGAGQIDWFGEAGAIVAVLGCCSLARVHLRRSRTPLLDLSVFKIRTFRISAASGSISRLVISAVPFVLALMFQVGFGWSPVKSGLLVIGLFIGNIAIKPFTTPILRRFGFRKVLVVVGPTTTLSLLAIAVLGARVPLAIIVVVLIVNGALRSTAFTVYNSIAFADIESSHMTNANTVAATVQQISAGLGIAVGALVVRLSRPLGTALSLGGGSAMTYHVAFVVLACLAAIPLVEALRLSPTAGLQVTAAKSAD